MRIWLCNTRGDLSQPHELFSTLYRCLRERCGAQELEHFVSLKTLAELPWLDQPEKLDPGLLALELYATWDKLWTLELSDLAIPMRRLRELEHCSSRAPRVQGKFGDYFAKYMHQLASFAASTSSRRSIRAATHRGLALGSTAISELRLIQGGQVSAMT